MKKLFGDNHNRYAGLDVLINDHKWSKKIPLIKLKTLRTFREKIILTPHVGGVASDAKNITRNIILDKLLNEIKNFNL